MRAARRLPPPLTVPLAVALIVTVWVGYYVCERGFGRRWRGLLASEFQRFGLVISVRRLTLDPFRGLIAQDVDVFQDEARENLLAQVSDLSLDVNYAALLAHEPALNAVDLRHARLSIPLGNGRAGPIRLRIRNVQARVYFVPGRIEVRQLSGDALGIRCSASGTLINPANFAGFPTDMHPPAGGNEHFLDRLITEVQRLKPARGSPPQLSFTFQGDMADLGSLRIQDGALQARQLDRLGYRLSDLRGEFKLENGHLDVRQLVIRDDYGEASASGSWDFLTGEQTFGVRSSLNLTAFLAPDPRCGWARDWAFERAPFVEMTGTVRADGHVRYLGKVSCDGFTYRSVRFGGLRAAFAKNGSAWMVTDAEVTHRSGTVTGEVMRRPGEFRVRLQSGLRPDEVGPLLPAAFREKLAQWEWEASPVLQINLHGPAPLWEHLSGDGQLSVGRTKVRGMTIDSGHARFGLTDGILEVTEARASRDDGECSAAFTWDPIRGHVQLASLHGRFPAPFLAACLNPELARNLEAFAFSDHPAFDAEADGAGGLRARLETAKPVELRLPVGALRFTSARAEVNAPAQSPMTARFAGELGGGTVTAEVAGFAGGAEDGTATVQLSHVHPAAAWRDVPPFFPASGSVSGTVSVDRAAPLAAGEVAQNTRASVTWQGVRLTEGTATRAFAAQLRRFGLVEPADLTLTVAQDASGTRVQRLEVVSEGHRLNLRGEVGVLGFPMNLAGDYDGKTPVRLAGSPVDPEWEIGGSPVP